MNLGSAYNSGLSLTLALSMLAVLLGGELHPLLWLSLAAPSWLFWRRDVPRSTREARGRTRIGTALAVMGLAWAVWIVFSQGVTNLLPAAVTAMLCALVGRTFSAADATQDLQSLMLSLLLLIAGAGVHTQVTYGVVFVLYAIAATWALSLRQLFVTALTLPRAEAVAVASRRDLVTTRWLMATGSLAIGVLMMTLALFVLFPRVGFGSLAWLQQRRFALPEDIRLDEAPHGATAGGGLLARLYGMSMHDFEHGIYLRSTVFDEASARGFRRSARLDAGSTVELPLAADGALDYEVFLQPVTERELFTLGLTRKVEIVSGGAANPSMAMRVLVSPLGAMTFAARRGPIRYRVHGEAPVRLEDLHEPLDTLGARPAELLARYLELPSDLRAGVATLARTVVGNSTDAGIQMTRLAGYLRQNYTYTLEAVKRDANSPLTAFLSEDKRGHCEFFAAALAVLARAVGVPARVVGGVAGGTWDDEGSVVVFTEQDAHAWVEWYAPGRGWVSADATPVATAPRGHLAGFWAWRERTARFWDDYILEFGLDTQLEMARRATAALSGAPRLPSLRLSLWPGLLYVALLVAVAALLWRFRRRRSATPTDLARLAHTLLSIPPHGAAFSHSVTVRAAVDRCANALSEPDRFKLFAALQFYEAARFGGAASPRRVLRQHLRAVRRLRLHVSSRSR